MAEVESLSAPGIQFEHQRSLGEGVSRSVVNLIAGLFIPNFESGSDACALPVLTPHEAAALDPSRSCIPTPHPYVSSSVKQISAAATDPSFDSLTLRPGQHTQEVLKELGLSAQERQTLARAGVLGAEAQAAALSAKL
jgi:hypothetical protein